MTEPLDLLDPIHYETVRRPAATFDEQAESVLCTSPAGLLGLLPVRVTLNGQQFTDAVPGAQLTFFEVDVL